jgi:hypothetical protein
MADTSSDGGAALEGAVGSGTSGSGGTFASIANIFSTIGSVFVSYKTSEAKQIDLEQAKESAKSATSLASKNIALETIKLKELELTAAQKTERSKSIVTGVIMLAAIGFMAFTLYLVLGKPKPVVPKVVVPVAPKIV